MPVKIRNTRIPADEHFPYGGYYLQRTLPNGKVLAYQIKRPYATTDWQWAQNLKKAREVLGVQLDELLEAIEQAK